MTPEPIERRQLLRGAATLGVGGAAAGLLAACGNDPGSAAREAGPSASSPTTSPTGGTPDSTVTGGQQALVAVADVPVGGGVILTEPTVVVTRPEKGTVAAFSSVCTHQGCLVVEVVDGAIVCGCHGSRFSVADGSVLQGPATVALPVEPVTVQGGSVFLG